MSPPRYVGGENVTCHFMCVVVDKKVLVEGASQFCKCVFTVVMVMWFPQWGMMALSIANVRTLPVNISSLTTVSFQLSYSVLYFLLYYVYFYYHLSHYEGLPVKRLRDVFPKRIPGQVQFPHA